MSSTIPPSKLNILGRAEQEHWSIYAGLYGRMEIRPTFESVANRMTERLD
jgi:hypothetical protein